MTYLAELEDVTGRHFMSIEGFSNYPPFNQSNNPAGRSRSVPLSSIQPEPAFHIPEANQPDAPNVSSESFNMKNALNDVNEWANQRVAIFATLDAALSKAVVEAVSALSELKQRAEDEARATTAAIMAERDVLQQQIQELRSEQTRLQNQAAEAEHRLENLETRRIAAEREINQLLENASRERTQLQTEVDRLKARTYNMNQQLQTFFEQRFAELWEQFSKTAAPSEAAQMPDVAEIFGKDFEPSMLWPELTPAPVSPTTSDIEPVQNPIKAITRQEFEDAPTPKANIVPIKPENLLNANAASEMANTAVVEEKSEEAAPIANPPTADPLAPLERVVFNQEKEIELDESDFVKIFNKAKKAKSSRKAAENSKAEQLGPTPTQQQRQVTQQQVERILRKRKPRSANKAATVSTNDEAKVQPNVAKEKAVSRNERERQVYEELGELLGVEITTPPQSGQMLFAEGFTPPPDLSNQWFAMANQVEAVKPPAPSPAPTTSPKPRKQPDYSEYSLGDEPPSVTLEDIFSSFPADLPIDDEAELSSIDEISPTIGELGPDFAWHWHDDDLKEAEAKSRIEPAKPNSVQPPEFKTVPVPSYMNIARPDIAAQIFEDFPDFSLVPPPPPRGATIVSDSNTGQITKIVVSNLQGIALLNIERVVRGLPGVYQVVVTTLEKGEIGMEVRHHPELELDKVLPNLPDFKLKLTESGENLLKFVQVR